MIWREDSRRLHWGVVLFGLLILPSGLLFLFFFTRSSGASAPSLAEITAGKATPSPAAAPLAAPPPAPTSASPPIYLQAIGDTTRVSVDSFGSQSNGNSYDASMSADSNFVGFDSFANNLVVLDTNGRGDVFIHDRLTGATTRLSLDSSGVQGNGDSAYPSVSGDGSMVSFRSAATNLIPSDTNGVIDIFLRNRPLSSTSLVSSASDATLGNGASLFSAISSDGAVVSFHSSATNLVLNDTNGVWDIFTKDVGTGVTRRVSISSGGVQGNGDSLFPAISQDGRYVTFHSMATNLVPGDTFAFADVFRHDRATGTTVRVSLTYTGDQANGSSYNPSISFDGRYIAFESAATNLVAADTNNATDIFLRDVLLGTTRRISVASDLTQANSWSGDASISGDAHYISYHSNATNLVPGDTNNALDVFVYNTQTGHTERSSVSTSGIEGNASSTYSSIGGDGRFVAFSSSATNLVVGDTNAADDVFVHELTGNTATPSLTPTSTSTITPSPTLSLTPTNTATYTSTPSNTPSETPSPTSTFSPTPSETPTETSSPTNTPTPSDTVPPSDTPTPTATWTPSLTPTITLTPTQSDTPSPTLSPTSSATWTPSNTPTVSPTPTQTFTPSNTPTPSETPTITPSPTPTFTQTPTNTFTPTLTPTNTNTPTSTYTPTETFTPTNTWTPSMTPTPTLTPTITPSVTVIPPPVYIIQGRVTDEAGNPLEGVIILVNDAETTLTDENGYYTLSNLVEGTYTIAASASGYVFTTSVEMPLILPPSHLNVDFVGKTTVTYTITGQVKDVLGKPMAGVTVEFGPDLVTTLDLEEGRRVITDTAGIFVIRGLNAGRYVLSPTVNGFNFTPARREVGVPPSASGQVFIGIKASPATYTISGRIVEPSGKPLPGVIINLGARLSVISDANGNFNMRGVPPGTYVLSAQKSGFLFTPATRTINVPHDLSNLNFSAVRKR